MISQSELENINRYSSDLLSFFKENLQFIISSAFQQLLQGYLYGHTVIWSEYEWMQELKSTWAYFTLSSVARPVYHLYYNCTPERVGIFAASLAARGVAHFARYAAPSYGNIWNGLELVVQTVPSMIDNLIPTLFFTSLNLLQQYDKEGCIPKIICPKSYNEFEVQLNEWKKWHKKGDVVFIFNPNYTNNGEPWIAYLLKNEQKDAEEKYIEVGSVFGKVLSKVNLEDKSPDHLNEPANELRKLLQTNTLFKGHVRQENKLLQLLSILSFICAANGREQSLGWAFAKVFKRSAPLTMRDKKELQALFFVLGEYVAGYLVYTYKSIQDEQLQKEANDIHELQLKEWKIEKEIDECTQNLEQLKVDIHELGSHLTAINEFEKQHPSPPTLEELQNVAENAKNAHDQAYLKNTVLDHVILNCTFNPNKTTLENNLNEAMAGDWKHIHIHVGKRAYEFVVDNYQAITRDKQNTKAVLDVKENDTVRLSEQLKSLTEDHIKMRTLRETKEIAYTTQLSEDRKQQFKETTKNLYQMWQQTQESSHLTISSTLSDTAILQLIYQHIAEKNGGDPNVLSRKDGEIVKKRGEGSIRTEGNTKILTIPATLEVKWLKDTDVDFVITFKPVADNSSQYAVVQANPAEFLDRPKIKHAPFIHVGKQVEPLVNDALTHAIEGINAIFTNESLESLLAENMKNPYVTLQTTGLKTHCNLEINQTGVDIKIDITAKNISFISSQDQFNAFLNLNNVHDAINKEIAKKIQSEGPTRFSYFLGEEAISSAVIKEVRYESKKLHVQVTLNNDTVVTIAGEPFYDPTHRNLYCKPGTLEILNIHSSDHPVIAGIINYFPGVADYLLAHYFQPYLQVSVPQTFEISESVPMNIDRATVTVPKGNIVFSNQEILITTQQYISPQILPKQKVIDSNFGNILSPLPYFFRHPRKQSSVPHKKRPIEAAETNEQEGMIVNKIPRN